MAHDTTTSVSPDDALSNIGKVLRRSIEAGTIPGVVAMAADDRGIFYKGAFGRRFVDKADPIASESVFRIASMTKAVTGTAAMQLVEQGRIGLRT
jgi:methyl acetate hydrolase